MAVPASLPNMPNLTRPADREAADKQLLDRLPTRPAGTRSQALIQASARKSPNSFSASGRPAKSPKRPSPLAAPRQQSTSAKSISRGVQAFNARKGPPPLTGDEKKLLAEVATSRGTVSDRRKEQPYRRVQSFNTLEATPLPNGLHRLSASVLQR